ncbi:10946_t:CDS:1, partial [Acaulospora colombiana]
STEDKESSIEPSARRGIWDRWPLLQQSVHVPEWTLQDEVKAIAEKTMKDWAHNHQDSASAKDAAVKDTDGHGKGDKPHPHKQREPPVSPGATSEATQEEYWDVTATSVDEGLLSQSALHGLSLEAATFLSHIFGLLAAHRPAHDASLQNRLNATDWKTALSILASSEIISNE